MKMQLAGCVVLDGQGGVLLLHRNEAGVERWELPGGEIMPGETAEQTAVRSVREELGIDARITKTLGDGDYEKDDAQYHFVWFQASSDARPGLREANKFDDARYFKFSLLHGMPVSAGVEILREKIAAGQIRIEE
ncbi:NUDIX hydrolase [Candidatus Saccharibacteria bacterium]|nr:MAG: NUDIX hydrolase [Candidatus Saccharibacteria bacterium]